MSHHLPQELPTPKGSLGLILVHFRDSGQGRAWTRVGTRDLDVGSWSRDWREGLGTRETGDRQTADGESDGRDTRVSDLNSEGTDLKF